MAKLTRTAAALGLILVGLAAGCRTGGGCAGGSCAARSSGAGSYSPPAQLDPLYSTPTPQPSTLPSRGGSGGGRVFEGSGSR